MIKINNWVVLNDEYETINSLTLHRPGDRVYIDSIRTFKGEQYVKFSSDKGFGYCRITSVSPVERANTIRVAQTL